MPGRAMVVVLLLLAGCSGYRAPGVEVTGAALGETTAEAFEINFDLLVSNANAKPLELEEVRYHLWVDGRAVYEGRREVPANLSALGEQLFMLPAIVPTPVAGGLLRYELHGSLRYRTPGQLAQRLFDTGVRRPKTGFSHEGALEVPQSEVTE